MKPIPVTIREMVQAAVVAEPTRPYYEIAQEYGVSAWMVCKIAKDAGLSRPRGAGSPSWRVKQGVTNA